MRTNRKAAPVEPVETNETTAAVGGETTDQSIGQELSPPAVPTVESPEPPAPAAVHTPESFRPAPGNEPGVPTVEPVAVDSVAELVAAEPDAVVVPEG